MTWSIRWQQLDGHPRRVAIGVFGVSLIVYLLTLAPGLLWGGGDFATFQLRAYTGEGLQGGVFGHSLWIILSRPFMLLPINDPAYRANLASAVFAALALAFVFLSARKLTTATGPALLGTTALLLSHTFWTYAVMSKVYSLNTLLLALDIYVLLCWRENRKGRYLSAFGVLFALGIMNHLVMATGALGYAVYIFIVMRRYPETRRQLIGLALMFVIGLIPYLAISQSAGDTGSTVEAVLGMLSSFVALITRPGSLLLGLGVGLALLIYQFPLTVFVGPIGARAQWRADRTAFALLSLIMLGDLAFLLAATDPRAGDYAWNLHYYLQVYVPYALWIALGFAAWWPRFTRTRLHQAITLLMTLALPIGVYLIAPVLARPFVSNLPSFREIQGRDNLTYVLSPWKQQETGPRQLTDEILAVLPPNSVLLADYSIWSMLDYRRVVENARPDVTLIEMPSAGIGQQLPLLRQYRDKPLFIADVGRYYDMTEIEAEFAVTPLGPIYRVTPKG